MVRLGTLTNGLAPNPLTVDADVGEPWTGKLISYPDLDFTSGTWAQDRSGNHAAYTEVGTLTEGASYPPVAAFDAGESNVLLLTAAGMDNIRDMGGMRG
jgi:hypothetical protein